MANEAQSRSRKSAKSSRVYWLVLLSATLSAGCSMMLDTEQLTSTQASPRSKATQGSTGSGIPFPNPLPTGSGAGTGGAMGTAGTVAAGGADAGALNPPVMDAGPNDVDASQLDAAASGGGALGACA